MIQFGVLTWDEGDDHHDVSKFCDTIEEAREAVEQIIAEADPPFDRVWIACREMTIGPWTALTASGEQEAGETVDLDDLGPWTRFKEPRR